MPYTLYHLLGASRRWEVIYFATACATLGIWEAPSAHTYPTAAVASMLSWGLATSLGPPGSHRFILHLTGPLTLTWMGAGTASFLIPAPNSLAFLPSGPPSDQAYPISETVGCGHVWKCHFGSSGELQSLWVYPLFPSEPRLSHFQTFPLHFYFSPEAVNATDQVGPEHLYF